MTRRRHTLLDKAHAYMAGKSHSTRGPATTKAQAEVILACLRGEISLRSMMYTLKIPGGNIGKAFSMLRSCIQSGRVKASVK